MGETFVRWFYHQLNCQNPVMRQRGETSDFGPQHFWENCNFKMMSATPSMSQESFEGSFLVAQRLSALVQEELLMFNPNISEEGVKVQSDPHGLFMVMVCGTLHQQDNLVGMFKQMFGLARNPLDQNNWKVKVTELLLRSTGGGNQQIVPRLTDFPANGGGHGDHLNFSLNVNINVQL